MTKSTSQGELHQVRHALISGLIVVFFFSFLIAFGALIPALYHMQMLDRVLSSRSEPTLYALTILVVFLMILLGVLMFARARLMTRLANRLDDQLGPRVFELVFRVGLEQPSRTSLQPLDDLAALRHLLAGGALVALLDAPFIPLFFMALYILHPWVGTTALGFGVVIGILALINSGQAGGVIREGQRQGRQSRDFLLNGLRNADAVQSMGMLESLRLHWLRAHLGETAEQTRSSDLGSLYGTAATVVRNMARVGVTAVSAYLVLQLEMSPGLLIAAMILTGRALSPLQSLISGWPQLVEARLAYRRLAEMLDLYPPRAPQIRLPEMEGAIRLEAIFAGAGNRRGSGDPPILRGINLVLSPGETLAVLGPSGSGKTTLARVMLGLWPTLSGRVRFDGADVQHWDPLQFGRYVGYLPQDVQLFAGTIADNIARFGRLRSEKVIAAAKLAGVHSMILNLGKGYLTEVGPGGLMLSAGQRQRIALARALYNDPRVVVMDEPNSNLDEDGHTALMNAVESLKRRGSTLVFISHRRAILDKADQILILSNGQVRFLGTRAEFHAAYAGNTNEPSAKVIQPDGLPQQIAGLALQAPSRPDLQEPWPEDDGEMGQYDARTILSRWRPIRAG